MGAISGVPTKSNSSLKSFFRSRQVEININNKVLFS